MNIHIKTKINKLIYNNDFYKCFDNDLINYIKSTTSDTYNVHKALKNLYLSNILKFEEFKNIYSYENNLKIWKGSRFGWDSSLSNYMKGKKFRNKKRPEHAKKMKVKMKGIKRTEEWKKLKTYQNRSIDFKITFLKNKSINIDGKKESEIIEIYSKYISDVRNSKKYKIKKIKKFLNNEKYINHDLHKMFITYYNENKDNLENVYKKMFSVISLISMETNENMGKTIFFKSGFIETIYCKNKSIIKYRSSYEEKTINFLEKNQISYKYEPFYIEKGDNGYYLPDFLIFYKDKCILLEIKGFIRGEIGKKNEEEKINAAKKYCKKNNMTFKYLRKPLTKIEELIN